MNKSCCYLQNTPSETRPIDSNCQLEDSRFARLLLFPTAKIRTQRYRRAKGYEVWRFDYAT